MRILGALLALTAGVSAIAAAAEAAAFRVDGGQIADVAPDRSGIRVFKGIPFAAPPVGELRWKAPQPLKPWDGTREADAWGPRCVQSSRLGDIDPLNARMSEDCLYLNVWTPAKSNGDRLPVMLWIYGGSLNVGSGSQPEYDGANLAKKGVVVVTINYRVDVFGFLAHPELAKETDANASGNYGIQDQIAALKWVQKNIAAFGGDLERVTIFGESAGSFSVSMLMASPSAKGLFARAIGESGAWMSPLPAFFGLKPRTMAEQDGLKFAQSLGASTISDLRAKSADELLQASVKDPAVAARGVIDGYVIAESPAAIFAQGRQNDVPLLVGWNADEGTYFAARIPFGPGTPTYADRIRQQFKEQADAVLKLYAPEGSAPEQEKAAFAALLGDELIGYGGWAWAERVATTGKSPTYRYYFNRRPPGAPQFSGVRPLAAPGVYHSAELCYVFNNLQAVDWPWEAEDRRLADAMSSYWVNFAKTGDPNGEGLPRWPAYKPGGGGQMMELGKDLTARPELHRDRYEFLDGLYQKAASQ